MNHPTPPSADRVSTPVRVEARKLIALATPVAIAQVGGLSMGLVDTWMVGRLGAIELAAVALGDACFFTLQVFAMGILMALNPLISQAYGAGDPERCAEAWRAGIRLSLILALPLALAVFSLRPLLNLGHLDPFVVRATMDYIAPRTLGILPMLLFVTNRTLFNAVGNTRPAMVVTLAAVVVNVFLDWVLIFGKLGAPALGVAGSGLGTAACRWIMCLGLFVWLKRHRYRALLQGRGVSIALLRKVLRLGVPIGLTHSMEVGAFATSSLYMGWLGVTALASHQIAIKMASTSFMVAISLGIATSIRVGNAIGAGRPGDAQRAAWTGVGLGLCSMVTAALLFLTCGELIVASFSADAPVIELGASLLVVAAAFQLSDGTQAICAGALRGAGDTTRPFVAQLLGHWVIGLPLGYVLAFPLGYGPESVWWALALGLTVAAILLISWMRGIKNKQALP